MDVGGLEYMSTEALLQKDIEENKEELEAF
jgi:hypothetical protein